MNVYSKDEINLKYQQNLKNQEKTCTLAKRLADHFGIKYFTEAYQAPEKGVDKCVQVIYYPWKQVKVNVNYLIDSRSTAASFYFDVETDECWPKVEDKCKNIIASWFEIIE